MVQVRGDHFTQGGVLIRGHLLRMYNIYWPLCANQFFFWTCKVPRFSPEARRNWMITVYLCELLFLGDSLGHQREIVLNPTKFSPNSVTKDLRFCMWWGIQGLDTMLFSELRCDRGGGGTGGDLVGQGFMKCVFWGVGTLAWHKNALSCGVK